MLNVTCALIIKNNKVLITQNGPESDHAFQWEFPGGKNKKDESDEACIIREIYEELELIIKLIERMHSVEHDYGIKKVRLMPFICNISGGNLKLNNHINKKWLSFEELYKIDFSDADKRLIQLTKNREILKEYTRK